MVKELGGIAAVEKLNNAKKQVLYTEIDRNPLFKGAAAVCRSFYYECYFPVKRAAHAETFDTMWKAANISGLPGHRSVGVVIGFHVQCDAYRKCSSFS
jgi:phosphoserine aminotransferase